MRRRLALLAAALLFVSACGGTAAPATPPAGPSGSTPAAGSSSPAATAPAGKLTPVSFEMAWIPIANQLPYYLALARGYYKARGLDVTIVSGKGSALTAQQVGAGKYDVGQTDLTVMALARGQGESDQAFMVELPKSPFGVFASKQEGISTWKDLYGKTVAVSAGSPEVFLLPATFKKLGLDLSRVREVNTSPADKTPDYLTGKVDAVGTDLAGYLPLVNPKRASNELWFGDVLGVPYLGLFARQQYIQQNPSVIRGIAAGSAEAEQALMDSPAAVQEAATDMVKANPGQGLHAPLFVASWNIYRKFLTTPAGKGQPIGWMSPASWSQTLQILEADAGLKGTPSAASEYTNAYLSSAYMNP